MTKPLLAFYGDDFTGSSAAMEVLAFAGIPTVMFLAPPSEEDLAQFPDIAAMGIAGVARSRDPRWMDRNLPAAFAALARFGAPVTHYKVCSTFDSSPEIGSIGRAIDIGAPILGGAWHPLVVGAPAIRRYQAFGNLFAGTEGTVHRLDRHPVMRRHPATPMEEADVRLHLARQTRRPIGLIDMARIKSGESDAALADALKDGADIIAIDVMDEETLTEAGRLIWNNGQGPVIAIGSQGVEYALVAHWRASGRLPPSHASSKMTPVDQIFCVSGSCSSINGAQIAAAEAIGFSVIDIDAAQSADPQQWEQEIDRASQTSGTALSNGKSVIVTTARGPDDPAVQRVKAAISASGQSPATLNDRIGAGLGRLVADIRRRTGLRRVAIAGGDTSGHAMHALSATALSAVAPLAPGAPLCRVHAKDTDMDGLEVTLKGGQMGDRDFFLQTRG